MKMTACTITKHSAFGSKPHTKLLVSLATADNNGTGGGKETHNHGVSARNGFVRLFVV